MTNSTKLLLSLFLVFFSAASQAQNFYVCDSNGSDDFDGRSEAKPFKSYDKAIWNFNKLDAGGSLLFCRGGYFIATNFARLHNSSCRADTPCTIGDYGDSNLDKPVIAADGIHAINFENSAAPKADGGYVVENLTLLALSKSGAGIRLFNDVNDLTISNVHIEGFNVGIYAAGSSTAAEGSSSNEANDRIVIKNSKIINNLKIGFLGSCNDCLIENSYFEGNGTHPSLDHNIYLSGSKTHKKGITIRKNILYRSAIVDGICQGVSLVGHGLLEDVLIEDNIIKEDAGKVSGGCWGISIDPGYRTVDESFRNIIIRNNKVINVGGNGIGCASCEGVTIEGNEIIDEANKLNAGIRVPVREENTVKSSNVNVRNNKVVLSNTGATGIWVGGENISQVNGNEIILPTDTRSECITLNQASLRIDISSNTCKTHNGVAIIEDNNLPAQDDEQVAENPPVDESPTEVEQEVVDLEPVTEVPDSTVPIIVDNNTVQEENSEQEVVVNVPVIEDITVITGPIETVQLPSPDIVETDSNITNEISQEPNTNVSEVSNDGSTVSLNDPIADDSSTTPIRKPAKATGGGSSGGGSSKAKKSTSTTTTTDVATSDDVITYTSAEPLIQPSSLMSIETEQMDVTSGLSKTEPESSKYSVKVKDVIEASRIESEIGDVTQCRAYAAGRCLMK